MKKYFQLSTFNFQLIIAFVMLITVSSCDVARQAQGAYNMVKCDYSYASMSGLSVAGINPSNMTLLDAPKILGLLSGSATSIPVGFTVNLDVKNPNATEAMLNGMEYVLAIDGIDFTTGALQQQLSVPAGATETLPLTMAFDVASLLKGDTQNAAVNAIKNLIGMGSGESSNVSLNIRPSFDVAGYQVVSPVFIPISFNFGGK
jgi:LEA14-like dessication related protein